MSYWKGFLISQKSSGTTFTALLYNSPELWRFPGAWNFSTFSSLLTRDTVGNNGHVAQKLNSRGSQRAGGGDIISATNMSEAYLAMARLYKCIFSTHLFGRLGPTWPGCTWCGRSRRSASRPSPRCWTRFHCAACCPSRPPRCRRARQRGPEKV